MPQLAVIASIVAGGLVLLAALGFALVLAIGRARGDSGSGPRGGNIIIR